MTRPFKGVFPVAPTPFTETGELDIDGQKRVLDCMIDQGIDGLCILANFSEQFLLTDVERETLAVTCLEHDDENIKCVAIAANSSSALGDTEANRRYIERYRELNPDDPTTLFNHT